MARYWALSTQAFQPILMFQRKQTPGFRYSACVA
jgi:hypothetical protein